MYNNIPEFIKGVHILPASVYSISSYYPRYYCIMRMIIEYSIRLIITGNPSTLLEMNRAVNENIDDIIEDILDKVSWIVNFMAFFSILTGIIVLIGSVRNSKYQRIKESVLLRTLGAKNGQILKISALEYLFLGIKFLIFNSQFLIDLCV